MRDKGSNPFAPSNLIEDEDERMFRKTRKNNSYKEDTIPFKLGQLLQHKPSNTLGTIIGFYKQEAFDNTLPCIQWHITDKDLPSILIPTKPFIDDIEIIE